IEDASVRPGASSPAREALALGVIQIGLTNFRSYARAALCVACAPVVLAGANGTGKTNLLEALSLLSPERGLRGARLTELQRRVPSRTTHPEDAFAEPAQPRIESEVIRSNPGLWAI